MTKLIAAFRNFANAPKNVFAYVCFSQQCHRFQTDVAGKCWMVQTVTVLSLCVGSVKKQEFFRSVEFFNEFR